MEGSISEKVSCVDLFCGAGGLTHGFVLEGIPVAAGIDLDPACRFPYEANNQARFVERDISKVTTPELKALFGDAGLTVLAGCAPCQPFSTYARRYKSGGRDGKYGLLYEFARLSEGVRPDVITMENVPSVAKHEVFHDFVDTLERLGYNVWFDVIDSSRYGVPQTRRRMVLLASLHGDITMAEPTHENPMTVRQAIGHLRPIRAGESSPGINCTLPQCCLKGISSGSGSRSRAVHGATGRRIWSLTVTEWRVEAPILASMPVWSGASQPRP
nr:DNA cytosine methyltransferase [Ferrovum sp.]